MTDPPAELALMLPGDWEPADVEALPAPVAASLAELGEMTLDRVLVRRFTAEPSLLAVLWTPRRGDGSVSSLRTAAEERTGLIVEPQTHRRAMAMVRVSDDPSAAGATRRIYLLAHERSAWTLVLVFAFPGSMSREAVEDSDLCAQWVTWQDHDRDREAS